MIKVEKLKQFIKTDLKVLLLDIVAVNAAYFLALLIRFYVNFQFRPSVTYYLDYFRVIAPVYTIVAVAVFFLFRLYGGMWYHSGLNDMNRIILANICASALHVAGTLVFRMRMPITYYVIGAFLQFLLTTLIRFAHRIFTMEKFKLARGKMETVPALVVGSGSLGSKVVHHLENNTPYRTVAIAGKDAGRTLDGIPVISVEEIGKAIQSKNVKAIFIADRDLSKSQRDAVTEAAQGLEIQDYTAQLSNMNGFLPVSSLMEVIEGPLTVVIDGKEIQYANGLECLSSLEGEYKVQSVQAQKVTLKKAQTDESWMKVYQEQTGLDVSYF